VLYKQKIKNEIEKVLNGTNSNVQVEKPKLKEHGDIATNVAMVLAKELKKNPFEIANDIKAKIENLKGLISKVEVAKPGFINIVVDNLALAESLIEVHSQKDKFGYALPKSKEKVLVEYVSANPTGDLHIGHGRQAAIGDSLAKVLIADGYDVYKEFYINDYGEQMTRLKDDARIKYWELKENKKSDKIDFEYQITIDKYVPLLVNEPDTTADNIGEKLKERILNDQKSLLGKCNVNFDNWFSETSLHTEGKAKNVLEKLKESGFTYEHEGALWFKAKEFKDTRDRVLIRSDGRPTYLLADIAYHINKIERKNKKLITVWGADHHGQEISLKGGLHALGYDDSCLEIVFVQLVSLKKEGQEVKMSKRAGTVVNTEEVLNEVGSDAFRYFLIESHPNNRMVFDLDLAKKQDKDNPVYYIQYAHARCCSIFRQITNPTGSSEERNVSTVTEKELSKWFEEYAKTPEIFMNLFAVNKEEYEATKTLILKILDFPEEISLSSKSRSPGRIGNYLKELATDFHQFYTVCRVLSKDIKILKARLGLIQATKITIANGLKILGINAPESM